MIKLRLVCGNCDAEQVFEEDTATACFEVAFQAGWDTVERFGYNACPRCPGVSVYFPMLYAQEAREAKDPEVREALLVKAAEATAEEWPG